MGSGSHTLPPALLTEIYEELRSIARRTLGGWRTGSLEATDLVHAAWLRMERSDCAAGLERPAFLAFAAVSIRRILIEHYRARRAQRRGGDCKRVPLVDSIALQSGPSVDLLALDGALEALAAIEPRQAQVVELRFFGGLRENEVAEVLGVSLRTVNSDWRFARAWLARRLRSKEPS